MNIATVQENKLFTQNSITTGAVDFKESTVQNWCSWLQREYSTQLVQLTSKTVQYIQHRTIVVTTALLSVIESAIHVCFRAVQWLVWKCIESGCLQRKLYPALCSQVDTLIMLPTTDCYKCWSTHSSSLDATNNFELTSTGVPTRLQSCIPYFFKRFSVYSLVGRQYDILARFRIPLVLSCKSFLNRRSISCCFYFVLPFTLSTGFLPLGISQDPTDLISVSITCFQFELPVPNIAWTQRSSLRLQNASSRCCFAHKVL